MIEPKDVTSKLVKIVEEVKIDILLGRWNNCHSLDAEMFLHMPKAMVSANSCMLAISLMSLSRIAGGQLKFLMSNHCFERFFKIFPDFYCK